MTDKEMNTQSVHSVQLHKIHPSNQFTDGLDRRLKLLDHEKLKTEDSEPLNMKLPKIDDSCEKGNDIVLNVEDEVRVKDFIASSLHMNDMMSGHSSDYSQSESLDRRYSTESASSSDGEDCTGNQCRICKMVFDDDSQLETHINSRRMSDKRYKCCNCQKTFRDNTQLKVHARKHTGEKPFECSICNKKFTVNGNLNKHMRIHTGEKRFECPDCGKKFTQFAHLEDHLKTHSGERPFVCTYCQAAFKTKARLRKHEKSHENTVPSGSNRRSVNCPKCNIVLKSNRQLASHLATHVQDTEGPFICHFCGKTFAKYQNVLDHQRRHTEMKTFYCDFCDKKFANGSHLRRHMNSHSGVRPYSCNNCKRSFPSSQNLKRHMMTHTGEKPYNCSECDRKFLTLENLNRHRRTHTGEKPFSCEICGRVFAHSTTAKEHIRTVHTGEKPFSCPVCKQRFAISKILYKHVRNKHPEHFPQFKQAQDLTPNMKKAMDKFKRGIKCEDEDNSRPEPDSGPSNVDIKTEANIPLKEEPLDEYEPNVKTIKKESSDESDVYHISKFESEEGEFSSVIKIEAKEELDDKNESC